MLRKAIRLGKYISIKVFLLLSLSLPALWVILLWYSPPVLHVHISQQRTQEDADVVVSGVINIREFLQFANVNVSDLLHLERNLGAYAKNTTVKTFKISLTAEEQKLLENSTLAKATKEYAIKYKSATTQDHNLLEKGPFALLPDIKTPCWYNGQRKLRCLPFFFLMGCPKCGTTDVYHMLKLHPEFREFQKEPHWWTRVRFYKSYDFDKYTRNMAGPLSHLMSKSNKPFQRFAREKDSVWSAGTTDKNEEVIKNIVTGDCSASTMWDNFKWPRLKGNNLPLEPTFTNADYIYHLNSKAKLVAILRNPVTRLYSDYIFFDVTKKNGPPEFHRDVVNAIRLVNKCFEEYSIRTCVHNKYMDSQIKVRIYIGIYFIHLMEWYRVFPNEQILILRLEDYAKERTRGVRQLYDFLTLGNITEPSKQTNMIQESNNTAPSNANNYKNSSMFLETRYILYAFYKPFNQALVRLLNDDRFDYGPF